MTACVEIKVFLEVKLESLLFIHTVSESYTRVVDFLRYNSTHHTLPIRKMIFVCL